MTLLADLKTCRPPRKRSSLVNGLVDHWQASNGTWLEMRPMRADDAPLVKRSLNKLSTHTRRSRFFSSIAEFSDEAVRRFVTVDRDREYLLVVIRRENGIEIPIAGGRFVRQDGDSDCTVSLLVGDTWQSDHVGRRILTALLHEASRRGLRQMHGEVLADNQPMLKLARSLHFVVLERDGDEDVRRIVRDIPAPSSAGWRGFLRRLCAR